MVRDLISGEETEKLIKQQRGILAEIEELIKENTSKDDLSKNSLFEYWQNKLGLNDWIIDLRTDCVPSDFELEDVCGEVNYTFENKTAVIKTLKEECYGERLIPYDFERTLIHELLHLKFATFEPENDTNEYKHMHQLIGELSILLAKLRRTRFKTF